ncbi:MAG TPA: VOC family protein [Luteibaculaceae bacterium]|nr:VOC family protein [Luteibaculaceae bacterium]
MIAGIHHIAILVDDLNVSLSFYCEVLGFTVESRHYRSERSSWKVDLSLNGTYCIELFTFPDAPDRLTHPEAKGLRHLAFAVKNIAAFRDYLESHGVACQTLQVDPYTQKKYFFFADPSKLPLEAYEI